MADKKISQLSSSTTPLAGTEVLPIVQSGSTVKVAVSDLTAGRSVSASTVLIPSNNSGITTGDPNNIVRFTDTDTTAAAGQPMGRIEWASSDASYEGVKGYIQVEATDGTPDGDMYFATQHNTGGGLLKRLKLQYDGDVNVLTGNLVVGTAGKGIDFSANTGAAGMTSELLDWYEEGTWTPVLKGNSTDGDYSYSTQSGFYTRIGNRVFVEFKIALSAVNVAATGSFCVIDGLPFNTADNYPQGMVFLESVDFSNSVIQLSITPRSTTSQLVISEINDATTSGNVAPADISATSVIVGSLVYRVA